MTDPFEREAYLSLADEFDPMGAPEGAPEPTLDEFDETYVEAATRFAQRLGIPTPWEFCSMDLAFDAVRNAERGEVR